MGADSTFFHVNVKCDYKLQWRRFKIQSLFNTSDSCLYVCVSMHLSDTYGLFAVVKSEVTAVYTELQAIINN